jgi:hypothetical protein
VDIGSPWYERNWRSVNHKMALRPNILADAAFDVAFEASIFLQDTDINLFASYVERPKNMDMVEEIFSLCFGDDQKR